MLATARRPGEVTFILSHHTADAPGAGVPKTARAVASGITMLQQSEREKINTKTESHPNQQSPVVQYSCGACMMSMRRLRANLIEYLRDDMHHRNDASAVLRRGSREDLASSRAMRETLMPIATMRVFAGLEYRAGVRLLIRKWSFSCVHVCLARPPGPGPRCDLLRRHGNYGLQKSEREKTR